MSQKDAPAFPHSFTADSIGDCSGMTLRQHFAGLAMQGMVSSIVRGKEYDRMRYWAQQEGLTVSQWIARDSFKQADAMLAQGEQPTELERITAERDALARAALRWWEDAQYTDSVEEPEFIALAIATGVEP